MRVIDRVVSALRRESAKPPRPGVLLKPRRSDVMRDYPADGLTPERLVRIMREADQGSLTAQMELYEQMEEKDAHLYSVANTRRLAVTGLAWEIVPTGALAGGGPARRAESRGTSAGPGASPRGSVDSSPDAVAAFCDEALRDLPGFEESLVHLSHAVGRNLSVVELVWEATAAGPRLAELVPVDFGRLVLGEDDEVRILTTDSDFEGILPPADKFIVSAPRSTSGHPSRGGLLRVTSLAFLAKHFAIKDWLVFAEVFGMPVRIARYAPNATPEEKRELMAMLKQLGADATAIFSKAVEVEIRQPRLPGETNLYENLCIYFDREISKAWLGQTLTTDITRARASAGAAAVHDRVRRDLRDDDLRREASVIRRDLLAPMARMAFGPDASIPHFRRRTNEHQDPERLGRILSVAVNELGARIPVRWAHAALGVPEARDDEAVLTGSGGAGSASKGSADGGRSGASGASGTSDTSGAGGGSDRGAGNGK